MSVAPHVADLTARINEHTVIVSVGVEDGVTEGDEVVVPVDDRETIGKTTQVGQKESVVELRI